MRKLADEQAAPVPGNIIVSFVTPGGLVVRTYADGGVLMRLHTQGSMIHLDAEDGLIAEFRSGSPPIPWSSKAARASALAEISGRNDIDPSLRRDLLGHVRKTPWYE